MNSFEVYDLETYRNQFLYCYMDLMTKEYTTLEVSNEVDNRDLIYEHLSNVTHQIGYNNKGFDYPIIEYILLNKKKLLLVKADDFAWMIHEKANEIIQGNDYYYTQLDIKQLDLYKLNHFDRFKISLKYCGFGLRMLVLQDLPIRPDSLLTSEQMNIMRGYVVNDVETTYALYERSKPLIELRKQSKIDYHFDCSSMSNTAVARNVFIKDYCQLTGINKYELKELSTTHNFIYPRDVISDKIKFTTPKYQELLDKLMLDNTNLVTDDLKYRFSCNTITCDIKKGGLHSLNNAGYYTNKGVLLWDEDFSAFYPNILLALELSPAHLNKEAFLTIVRKILQAKIDNQAKGDKLKTANAKISINSIYGLLNAEGSPVKDDKVLYSVTLNGELFLLMMCERFEQFQELKVKYQNTDGVMIQFPEYLKSQINDISYEFSKNINIPLEIVPIKAIYLENVSSYIAIQEDGKIKRKGSFKKLEDRELKDDSSAMIVPIALEQYFVNGIPIRETIEKHTYIFDFYIGVKKIDHATYYSYAQLKNGESIIHDYHDKVIRFYVTTDSSTLTKIYGSGKKEAVIKGYNTKIAQIHEELQMNEYKINYNYYIHQANKIIDKIFLSDSEMKFE